MRMDVCLFDGGAHGNSEILVVAYGIGCPAPKWNTFGVVALKSEVIPDYVFLFCSVRVAARRNSATGDFENAA